MGQNSVDRVLEERRQMAAVAPAAVPTAAPERDKFFSVLVGETSQEHFLELRFQQGLRTCFAYTDLTWFNYDPESGSLDLEFGGFLVTVKGRGLGGKIFDGIKHKRLAWLKERDSELEDHKGNETFIEAITISPPSSGAIEEPGA